MKFSDLKVGGLYQCKDKDSCTINTSTLEIDLSSDRHMDMYHHVLYLKKPFVFLGMADCAYLPTDTFRTLKVLLVTKEGRFSLEEDWLDNLVEL
jgi:hypothetical protein